MTGLRPFFSFYGSKYKLATMYPPPRFDRIVEPLAGSAGYSLLYPQRDVRLFDRDPIIVGVWDYLIKTKTSEIWRLPDLAIDGNVEDLKVCQEAKWLIGFWVGRGRATPGTRFTPWAAKYPTALWWDERVRDRIVLQQPEIRHWKVQCLSYEDIELGADATWFVDPPYSSRAGRAYKFDEIDYRRLGAWCRGRPGQVIVCESEGADWLPFKHLAKIRGVAKRSSEAYYAK